MHGFAVHEQRCDDVVETGRVDVPQGGVAELLQRERQLLLARLVDGYCLTGASDHARAVPHFDLNIRAPLDCSGIDRA